MVIIKYQELIELIKENPEYIHKDYNNDENNLVIIGGCKQCGKEVNHCHFENGKLEFDNGITKSGVKNKIRIHGNSKGKVKSIEFVFDKIDK